MKHSRLLFIVGSPRSGTTALTRLVMEHPAVLLADNDTLGLPRSDVPS